MEFSANRSLETKTLIFQYFGGLRIKEHPKGVDSECSAERWADDIYDRHNDDDDSRPSFLIEKSPSANHFRDSSQYREATGDNPDDRQDGEGFLATRQNPATNEQCEKKDPKAQRDDTPDYEEYPQEPNMLFHDSSYPPKD